MGGDKDFYKLELRSAWYFRGLFPGHVLEVVGRTGVAEAFGDTPDVPFYERFYLGGLYDLREKGKELPKKAHEAVTPAPTAPKD